MKLVKKKQKTKLRRKRLSEKELRGLIYSDRYCLIKKETLEEVINALNVAVLPDKYQIQMNGASAVTYMYKILSTIAHMTNKGYDYFLPEEVLNFYQRVVYRTYREIEKEKKVFRTQEEIKREIISDFSGDTAYLSNKYPCVVSADGIHTFYSVEHAMKAYEEMSKFGELKTVSKPLIRISLKGRKDKLPWHKKFQGTWEDTRDDILYALLQDKFKRAELKSLLIKTGDALLVYASAENDKYLGVHPVTREGTNVLGKTLMAVRQELIDAEFYDIYNTVVDFEELYIFMKYDKLQRIRRFRVGYEFGRPKYAYRLYKLYKKGAHVAPAAFMALHRRGLFLNTSKSTAARNSAVSEFKLRDSEYRL